MTAGIVIIVILVIITLIILLYSWQRKGGPQHGRNGREGAESAGAEGEAASAAGEPGPSPSGTGGKQDLAPEEEELELSFETAASRAGSGSGRQPAVGRADAEEEELDLAFDKVAEIAAGETSAAAVAEDAEGRPPALWGSGTQAGPEEERIPFILEGEEGLEEKSGEDVIPALDGVAREAGRIVEETPEALEERLDLFFAVDEEEEPEREEISKAREMPLKGGPEGDSGDRSPEGYAAGLRELETVLRRELSAAVENRKTSKLKVLERKLSIVCARLADSRNGFKDLQKLFDDIEEALPDLQKVLPGFLADPVRSRLRQGDAAEVRVLLDEAVSQLDETSPLGARLLSLNGCLAEHQIDFASALTLYRRAGAAVAGNPRCLYDAGRMARLLGKEEEAISLLEQLLGGGRLQDGVLEAMAQHELARVYAGAGDRAKAEPLLHAALAGMETSRGADHPLLGPVLHDLAVLYEGSGRYEEAEPLYRRALAVRVDRLGENHPDLAPTYARLAGLYEEMELEEKSGPLYEKALQIQIGVLGQEHPEVGTLLNHLANLLRRQGRHQQAEPMFRRSLQILEKALGPDHPNLAVVLNNLAELYGEMGDEEKAGSYQERAFALFQLPGGSDDFVEMEKDYDIDMNEEKERTIAGG